MRLLILPTVFASMLSALLAAPSSTEPWEQPYSGADVTGARVIGYWEFEAGAPTRDSSGHGHELKLEGAKAVESGRFGAGLELLVGLGEAGKKDERHAALVSAHPALSPKGAFACEMWIRPQGKWEKTRSPVILDKKYVSHSDYQWRFTPAAADQTRRLQLSLGFGADSETFLSEPFVPGEEWQHVAFSYDGAGEVRFFRNGSSLGTSRVTGRGSIAAGRHVLSIGDRVGSTYAGFPGVIDGVRLLQGEAQYSPLAVTIRASRSAWVRMEEAPKDAVQIEVRNLMRQSVEKVELKVGVVGISDQTMALEKMGSGEVRVHELRVPTELRPDAYTIRARATLGGARLETVEDSRVIQVVARGVPRMPVMMWGIGNPTEFQKELPRLRALGFTHCLGGGAPLDAVWRTRQAAVGADYPQFEPIRKALDFALQNGFRLAMGVSPGHFLSERPELQRRDREGKVYASASANPLMDPTLPEFCFQVGASVAKAFGDHPAWDSVLVNTEVRDSAQPSFSEADREAYRKASGREIPAEVVVKSGVEWKKLHGFPADRIVEDEDPLLAYYRWYWTVGDGWNALHSATHHGVHSTGRKDVWTWFDPAIRAPSLGGSGGEVDVLGQWSYSNPDPTRVGFFTDELRAMAANSAHQPRVMKMTQLFWYRSQTTVSKKTGTIIASPFDDHDPDAAYITISPNALRTSFWSMISRPLSGIMYHGWQALVSSDGTSAYRHTHSDTEGELGRLHREVIEPLGAALLRVGDWPADVAYLDSFTAQMFARRGSYGYGGDEAYLSLLHASLQPEVLFEEQVKRGELKRFKVLVLADCDVLPRLVQQRILEFQKKGGVVVGDPNLAPGVKADVMMDKIVRVKNGEKDKAAILQNALKIREGLRGRYRGQFEVSDPELLVRRRGVVGGDYVFVFNDRREAGTYVGQHGLMLENGVPASGKVTVRGPGRWVYDLVRHRAVEAAEVSGEDAVSWRVDFGPGEGAVFLVMPQPIAEVRGRISGEVRRGERVSMDLEVVDRSGGVVSAVVPMRVEIRDSAGRLAEGSGYQAAEKGRLSLGLDVANNDVSGMWEVSATELASGQRYCGYFRVR